MWKHNNIHLIFFFLSCLKIVMVWVNGSRITEDTLRKTMKSKINQVHIFACCFIYWSSTCWKTSRWMHDYCPIKCFLCPHNSITTQPFESCLFLSVLFSGLLLNFTVVSLPLPEYSLQCFYFPCSVLFLVLVLSSRGWTDGRERLIGKKGHLFSFICKMNEKKSLKGALLKLQLPILLCFPLPLT